MQEVGYDVAIDSWAGESNSAAIGPTTDRLCEFARHAGMSATRVQRVSTAIRSAVARSIATSDVTSGENRFSVTAASDGEWLSIRLDSRSSLDYMDGAPFVFASTASRVEVSATREGSASLLMEFAIATPQEA